MRNLIVCCDGTWNTLEDETNVSRLANLLSRSSAPPQLVKYQPGVGTAGLLDRIRGGLMGVGLDQNIRECYQWLVSNYQAGDKIYLFGYSRGAFTVRSLAGMVGRLGIAVPPSNGQLDQLVERLYRKGYRDKENVANLATFHQDSRCIQFIGVWDTVGALGIPNDKLWLEWLERRGRYRFHDVALGAGVAWARHAVAVDERRGSFAPMLWDEQRLNLGQNVKQLWFPGGHGDVGGGHRERGLADGALKWMIAESKLAGVNYRSVHVSQIEPNPLDVLHDTPGGAMKMLVTAPRRIPSLNTTAGSGRFHHSFHYRRSNLSINQRPYLPRLKFDANNQAAFDVRADEQWQWTGLYLDPGIYRFDARGEWAEGRHGCGPGGLRGFRWSKLAGNLTGWLERGYRKLSGKRGTHFVLSRRRKRAPWLALIGAVADTDGGNPGRDGTPKPLVTFDIGNGCRFEVQPDEAGYLYCFANDRWAGYGNNRGQVRVVVVKR